MKTLHIFGGGTFFDARVHTSLASRALGNSARQLARVAKSLSIPHKVHLTCQTGSRAAHPLTTNDDVEARLREILASPETGAVIFNVALCDVTIQIGDIPSGKSAPRIKTRDIPAEGLPARIFVAKKVLPIVKALRPDVVLVGFKTTSQDTVESQIARAHNQIVESGADFVVANDVGTRHNLVVESSSTAEPIIHDYVKDRAGAFGFLMSTLKARLTHA